MAEESGSWQYHQLTVKILAHRNGRQEESDEVEGHLDETSAEDANMEQNTPSLVPDPTEGEFSSTLRFSGGRGGNFEDPPAPEPKQQPSQDSNRPIRRTKFWRCLT